MLFSKCVYPLSIICQFDFVYFEKVICSDQGDCLISFFIWKCILLYMFSCECLCLIIVISKCKMWSEKCNMFFSISFFIFYFLVEEMNRCICKGLNCVTSVDCSCLCCRWTKNNVHTCYVSFHTLSSKKDYQRNKRVLKRYTLRDIDEFY